MGRHGQMLTFDKMKDDFYDPKLGMLKIGVLLARKAPLRVDEIMECRSLSEVAALFDIPEDEPLYNTGIRLLKEWLRAKGIW